jgi:hypothetical protein
VGVGSEASGVQLPNDGSGSQKSAQIIRSPHA